MTSDPHALEFRLVERCPTAQGERASFAVRIPPGLFAFQGHFPGDPVLPGIAQLLDLVLDRVHALWPELGQPRRVTRLKFRQKIVPDDELEVRLERDAMTVRFDLQRGPELCTQGTLEFVAPPR
jgi:3-hydroxymyristoyl/3-hydroxydecanoyl-(acyl carrier protein) dehydratase